MSAAPQEPRRRLRSRWQGEGEDFTLIVGLDVVEPEQERSFRLAFEAELERLLAGEHGYGKVSVVAIDPAEVASRVAAGAHRGEWEMADALGKDVWDDLCERAGLAAAAQLARNEER